MKITYRLTPEEYGDAQRAHLSSKRWRRWNRVISFVILSLLLISTVAISILNSEAAIMLRPALIVLPLFLLLLLLPYTNLLWRWQYNKIDSLKRECTAEINDDGIVASSEAARTEMKWISFIRCYESKNLFLIYQQPNFFNIVPKRAFAPGEVDQFRDLLQRKIPAQQ